MKGEVKIDPPPDSNRPMAMVSEGGVWRGDRIAWLSHDDLFGGVALAFYI